MIPVFYNRDFSATSRGKGLSHMINRLEWSQFGGPKYAQIDIWGSKLSVWQLVNSARQPVIIYDTGGERIWWGFVNEILIRDGAFEIGVSMDRVMNRVKVIYTRVDANGDIIGEHESWWETNDDSIGEYGQKEYIGKLNKAVDDTARAKRAILLEKYSAPKPISRALLSSFLPGDSQGKQITATLKCKGWWETLNWRYVTEPPIDGIYYQAWGDLSAQQMGRSTWKPVNQQFTVGARDVTVREVSISVSRVGSPGDNLTIGIYALDGFGNPTGAAMGAVSITGTELIETYRPSAATVITKEFPSGISLSASTQYGLQISRSGGLNANNFYEVGVQTSGAYAGGIFKRYNVGTFSWEPLGSARDMPFVLRVDNEVGTARQINDFIEEYAEFIEGVFYEDTGLAQSNFTDGRTTCMEEILELMEMGGVNGRQLLAKIDSNRYMTIYEEPDPDDDPEYLISKNGQVLYLTGNPVTTGLWRVPGSYARLKNAFPGIQPKGASGLGVQFIEEIHWTPRDGIRPIFRGQVRPEDLMKTEVT